MRDADFVWRLAKGTYYMSQVEGVLSNKPRKKELVYEFKDLAALALKLDDHNWNTHKWYLLHFY